MKHIVYLIFRLIVFAFCIFFFLIVQILNIIILIWNFNFRDIIKFEGNFYNGKTWSGIRYSHKNIFHFLINKKTYI